LLSWLPPPGHSTELETFLSKTTIHRQTVEKRLNPCCVSSQVVELKTGGKDIPVTTANRIAYIHLVADYRLNKQIRSHCLAFRQGLANVVNLEWLRMFDQQEIQVLISGARVPICLDDLKNFTNYSGGGKQLHWIL
ncbi:ubiquitin-protein ligase E3C-like, partial [Notothenia coriiceps]|uniref:HECT-type E3 ubiquitin transferase n=1 Tax=Notothenia coriiceps TaxID=8208 RepID=A0A6I9NM80_9TELE